MRVGRWGGRWEVADRTAQGAHVQIEVPGQLLLLHFISAPSALSRAALKPSLASVTHQGTPSLASQDCFQEIQQYYRPMTVITAEVMTVASRSQFLVFPTRPRLNELTGSSEPRSTHSRKESRTLSRLVRKVRAETPPSRTIFWTRAESCDAMVRQKYDGNDRVSSDSSRGSSKFLEVCALPAAGSDAKTDSS